MIHDRHKAKRLPGVERARRGASPRLGFAAKSRLRDGAFPSKRRSKPNRTERPDGRRGGARNARRAARHGHSVRHSFGGTRHGARTGRSVNQSAKRQALAAWRGTCPGVGAGSAAPEQSAGACDQAARQAEREAHTEGRHYFAQLAMRYRAGAQRKEPPCGEGPSEGSPQIRRPCASSLLCDVMPSRARDRPLRERSFRAGARVMFL
jgi:hypothetical protein